MTTPADLRKASIQTRMVVIYKALNAEAKHHEGASRAVDLRTAATQILSASRGRGATLAAREALLESAESAYSKVLIERWFPTEVALAVCPKRDNSPCSYSDGYCIDCGGVE
ncbi:hypothetical protein [Cryobacterium sp. Y62]|uniref:hypothetical protein n=1 Tax=Cryobacterium sp. Y62 TaxID=2048284 RepID=UPI000CE51598|nr:hypothetical protein [Cryobacterium sp. Y62]